jgi:hypothetical protein
MDLSHLPWMMLSSLTPPRARFCKLPYHPRGDSPGCAERKMDYGVVPGFALD